MDHYIYPPLIFVTLLFILWMAVQPSDRLVAFLCLIGDAGATYFISKLAEDSPNNSSVIYLSLFIILLIILVGILFANRATFKYKIISPLYLFSLLVTIPFSRSCYSDHKKDIAKKAAIISFQDSIRNLYHFDIDSFPLKPLTEVASKVKKKKKKQLNPTYPVIIYHENDDKKLSFAYELNQKLPHRMRSFNKDSIFSIIMVSDELVDLGTYNNGKTKAQKFRTHIRFLSRQFKLYNEITLEGGDPPSSISYRRSSPESRSGSRVSESEIILAIQNAFLN